jgi:hypothetical protein
MTFTQTLDLQEWLTELDSGSAIMARCGATHCGAIVKTVASFSRKGSDVLF